MQGTKEKERLQTITQRIKKGERLSKEEGLYLLKLKDPEKIEQVRQLADDQRKKIVGDTVRFASTLFIHPTNLCELNCQFCSFYAKPGWKKAWFLTPAQAEEKIRGNLHHNLNEIHIVGGLWRECNLDYYQELFARIHSINAQLHIKALTPVEYHFLAKIHSISIEEVFEKMLLWGLGSLPGGGAEILVEDIRRTIAPGKISSDLFLEIHKIAHNLGLPSNMTMLFNHIEEEEHIIEHLARTRTLQDETQGLRTFIPLLFGKEDNPLGRRKEKLKEKNIPLVYAVSRLMLDNIPHIKVLWNYVGVQRALEILSWGADDFSSTNTEEKVIKMAGSKENAMDIAGIKKHISQIGRLAKTAHSGE